MAHDLVIRAGRVVDGSGAPARTADVAVDGSVITVVGRVGGRERGRSTPTAPS
jgi:N-acyl-D-amino-acid deacylase